MSEGGNLSRSCERGIGAAHAEVGKEDREKWLGTAATRPGCALASLELTSHDAYRSHRAAKSHPPR